MKTISKSGPDIIAASTEKLTALEIHTVSLFKKKLRNETNTQTPNT